MYATVPLLENLFPNKNFKNIPFSVTELSKISRAMTTYFSLQGKSQNR